MKSSILCASVFLSIYINIYADQVDLQKNTSEELIKNAIEVVEKNEIMARVDQKHRGEKTKVDLLVEEAVEAIEKGSKKNTESTIETTKSMGSMKSSDDEEADIFLNFEEVSLANLISYITDRKNLNIIPDKNLEQIKVSVKTEQPYTLNQAIALLHTLLEKNGYAMVEVAGVQRIIPKNVVQQHPLPFYSSLKGLEPESLPDTDAIIRYMYYLKNIKAMVARDILVNILGEQAVEIQQDLDVIIMTQKANAIKFAMKVIKELDQGGLRQVIKMLKLQHTDPDVIVKMFDEIIGRKQEQESIRFAAAVGKKESAYFSANTKIIADSDRFYLVLMGQEQDIDRIIEFVYIFDQPEEAEDSRLWTVNLKYIEADRAKALIDRAIRPPQGTTDKQSLTSFKFFEDVVIAAETPKSGDQANYGSGNRLIIACGKEARPALKKLIDSIDKKYPQVAIEMMIVDVTQQLARELSAQLRNKTPDLLGGALNFQAAHAAGREGSAVAPLNTNLVSLLRSGEGQGAYFTLGDPSNSAETGNIWLYIRSLLKERQTNILSQPFMIVNNREPCNIQANDIRRAPGDFVAGSGVRSSRQMIDLTAKTDIQIIPRINPDGVVDLTIKIRLDEFLEESGADNQPGRQIRYLETRASMAEGQVLVLGGLNRSQQQQNFWHTPFLEKIPILGNLFKGRSRSSNKQNLFAFIRPSIIKPRNEGNPDDYTQMKIDYAKYQVLNVDAYSDSKDPIQRWFFAPRSENGKQQLKDIRAGIFRPIDDFKEGKIQPAEVNIQQDPYYQDSLKLEEYKKKLKQKRAKQAKEPRAKPIIFTRDDTKQKEEMAANIDTQGLENKKSIFFKKPLENLARRS